MSAISRVQNSLKGPSSRRLLIIGGIIILAGVLYYFYGMTPPATTPSSLPGVQVTSPTVQGERPVSQQMDEELATADQGRIDAVQTSGAGSVIPTIRATEQVGVDINEAPPVSEPPVIRRPEPPTIQRPTVTPPAIPAAPQPVAPVQQAQVVPISQGLAAIVPPAYPAASVEFIADVDAVRERNAAPPAPSPATPIAAPTSSIQLPLPGTILYAEMLSEANSDSPGPVLAQIVQGPLSGARLIGSFSTQRDTLVITFNTLSLGTTRDGIEVNETIPIQAFAVDAATIGNGVATDVDYHLLQNIGITFAASFVQGFGEAIAQSGQQIISNDSGTTIVNPTLTTEQQLAVAAGTAAGAAGESLSNLFGNRPITVKVRAGAGIGVFFLSNGGQ